MSKSQIVVPLENGVFHIFEGIVCQLRFQILVRMKRADRVSGFVPIRLGARAMTNLFRKLLKSGPPRRRGITRGSLRDY